MGWMIWTLLVLLVWGAVRDRGGPLWRWLVEGPATRLEAVRPRHVLAIVLFLLIAPLMTELALPGVAMIMAVDLAAWIEVAVALLVVARVAPGWKVLRNRLAGAARRSVVLGRGAVRRLAVRARRPGSVRRPAGRPGRDDEEAGWVFA
jgi:hypothetical protein